jgi:hypothetical protein
MWVKCACDGEAGVPSDLAGVYRPESGPHREDLATIAARAESIGFDVTLLHEWVHHLILAGVALMLDTDTRLVGVQ